LCRAVRPEEPFAYGAAPLARVLAAPEVTAERTARSISGSTRSNFTASDIEESKKQIEVVRLFRA